MPRVTKKSASKPAKPAPKKPAKPAPKKPVKKPIKSIPISAPSMGQESTVSVRRITNGFVVREEKWVRNKYMTKETFSKTNPISIGGPA